MIQSIDTAGNLTWQCQHVGEQDGPCGQTHQYHISHEQIQWSGHPGVKPEHQTVSLPPCSACGAQTFLKVHFTERELKAPNMWQAWNSYHEEQLAGLKEQHAQVEPGSPHHAALAGQINQLEQAKQAGGYHLPSHAVALRHQELARQLLQSGKAPTS